METVRLPWLRIGLVAAAVAGLVVLRIVVWPEADAGDVRTAVEGTGAWAPAIVLVAFVSGTAALLPVTLFNLAAGALFPLQQALLLAYVGTLAAAQAHFWLAHTMGPHVREALERRVPRAVARLDDRRVAVLLTLRIVPVFPFAPTNYALSLGRIPWRAYTLTGAVGHVPGTLVAVLVGAALIGFDLGSMRSWLLAGGIAAAALGVALLGWYLFRRYGRREWVE